MFLRFRICSLKSFELLYCNNTVYVESCSKISFGIVDTTTIQIASQKHYIEQMWCAVEIQRTRSFVFLTSIECCCNNRLGFDVVLTKISSCIRTLKFLFSCIKVNSLMDCIKLIIIPDRTNMIFMNFIRIAVFTTITNHGSHNQFFIQSLSHDVPLICNYVEVCNIGNIVTLHSIFDVDSLWICCTGQQFNLSHLFFVVTFLLVTFSFKLCNTGVSLSCTNTVIRALMNLSHSNIDPGLVSRKCFRLTFFQKFIFREELFNFIIKYAMRQS